MGPSAGHRWPCHCVYAARNPHVICFVASSGPCRITQPCTYSLLLCCQADTDSPGASEEEGPWGFWPEGRRHCMVRWGSCAPGSAAGRSEGPGVGLP